MSDQTQMSARDIVARRKANKGNGNAKLDATLSAFIPDWNAQSDAFKNEWRGYLTNDGPEATKKLWSEYMEAENEADDDGSEIVRSTEISVSARATSIGIAAQDFAKQMDAAFVQVLRDGVDAEMKRQFSPVLALQGFERCYTKDQILGAPMVGTTKEMVQYIFGADTNQPHDTFTVMEPNSEGTNRAVKYSYWEIEYESTPVGAEYRAEVTKWTDEEAKYKEPRNPRMLRWAQANKRTANKKYNTGFRILTDAFIVLRKMYAVSELLLNGGCVFQREVDLKTGMDTDTIMNTPQPIKVWDKNGANDATNPATFSIGTFRRVDVDWARTGKALRPDMTGDNLVEVTLQGKDGAEVILGTVAALQATLKRNTGNDLPEAGKLYPVPTKNDDALVCLNALASYYNIEDDDGIKHVGSLKDLVKSNRKSRKNDDVAVALLYLWKGLDDVVTEYGDDIRAWENELENTENPVQALVNKAKAANASK